MRSCLLLGLLLFCSSVLAALPETPQFRQLTVADGLPSSTLYAITEDKQGYLWIASKDGLARFDGVGYKIFRYAPGDENALPGNVVQALHVDARNQLWMATEGHGISRLNEGRRNFTHFSMSTDPEMGSDDIWAITSTQDGSLWFGGYGGGLHRMDSLGRIHRYMSIENDPASLPSDTILSLAVDAQNRLWVGTTKGLCFWDGKKFHRVRIDDKLDSYIMQLHADADGSIWVGTQKNGLLHVSSAGIGLGAALLPGKMITGLWQDRQKAIWFSDGPNVYQLRDSQLMSYTPDSRMPAKIYGVFEDHEGGFWFPTEDRGLLRLPAGWRNFSIFRPLSQDENSLSGVMVRSASQADATHAWLVSDAGGLDKINLATGRIEHVLRNTDAWAARLFSVLQTKDGAVWMGHYKGLTRYDPATRKLQHFPSGEGQQDTLPGVVRLLMQTDDGLLWSASYGGGIQARDVSGRVVYRIVKAGNEGLPVADPDQFAVGPDGKLWVASAAGLLRWNADQKKFIAVAGSPVERIDAFGFQSSDTIWLHYIGVLEAFRWDGTKLQSTKRVSGDDGLPPVEAGSMLFDLGGNLWLTTTRGLLRYNILRNQVRMFGERDGLPSQEFDMQPALMTTGGLALVSTSKGLVIFDSNRIRNQKAFSPLTLDSLSVRRGEDTINFPVNSSSLKLKAGDRDLSIKLRLLSFDDAAMHRYRFQLKNFDSDWVDLGASGERVFSNLPTGNYQLQAQAADAEGRWSSPVLIKLQVLPPWWQTKWAMTIWGLLAAVLFLTTAWLYQRRVSLQQAQRLREQAREIAEQNSTAKSMFLATLGHEIRTPMTGVLGMAELLQASELSSQQRHRVNSIQGAGQHLLHLVNDVLDLAQIESGKLRLHDEVFDVKALMSEVSEFLKPLAEKKGLRFLSGIEKSTPGFCRGDAGRVRQILLNLGNNAIKFTDHGQITIGCAGLSPNGLRLQVSDTGPGMSREQQSRLFQRFEQADGQLTNQRYGGSGLGLAICQELAVAMQGSIEVSSKPGSGAVFIVELPLPNSEIDSAANIFNADSLLIRSKALKILLVEDEPVVAEVLQGLLQAMGHEVSHAEQGLQALALLSLEKFDLALLDLDLPGIDGLELARLIQVQAYRLPLAAITARADAQAEPAAIAAGMKAFMRKPVSSLDLQALLEKLELIDHSE